MVRKLKKKNLFISPELKRVKDDQFLITFPEAADKQIKKHYGAVINFEKSNVAAAQKELNDIIKTLKGHFASYNLLIVIAQASKDQSKTAKLYNTAEKDAKIILNAIGNNDKISWDYTSNRDFLRFLYLLGQRALSNNNTEKATEIFNTLLRLDTADNQGVKAILAEMNGETVEITTEEVKAEAVTEVIETTENTKEEVTVETTTETVSFDGFNSHLVEKALKEATIKEHMENIALFAAVISNTEATLEELTNIFKSGITKSRLNKLSTTLNQYFRFAVADKNELKTILGDIKTLKEELLNA